jgi:hypothetical protein
LVSKMSCPGFPVVFLGLSDEGDCLG